MRDVAADTSARLLTLATGPADPLPTSRPR
jgi:hypothetical protein